MLEEYVSVIIRDGFTRYIYIYEYIYLYIPIYAYIYNN